jgi:hypothetical protein
MVRDPVGGEAGPRRVAPARVAGVLVVTAATIAGLVVTVLFLLSLPHGSRDVIDLVRPVIVVGSAAAVAAGIGAAPYSSWRGRAPWSVLWAASIAGVLLLAAAAVAVVSWWERGDGSLAYAVVIGAPVVVGSVVAAVPVTEAILRVR